MSAWEDRGSCVGSVLDVNIGHSLAWCKDLEFRRQPITERCPRLLLPDSRHVKALEPKRIPAEISYLLSGMLWSRLTILHGERRDPVLRSASDRSRHGSVALLVLAAQTNREQEPDAQALAVHGDDLNPANVKAAV